MNSDQAVQRLVWALLQPLHRSGIHTLDMQPWGQRVRIVSGPTVLTVHLQLHKPERDMTKAVKMAAQMEAYVARAFSLKPGASKPLRVTASGQYLNVEVPLGEGAWRPTYPELAEQAIESILLGIDMHNQPVALDLTQEIAGLFVVGASGSGKTNVLRLIAAQALSRGWQLWLADLKGGAEWRDMWPYARRGARDTEGAVSLISDVLEIVTARNRGEAAKDDWLLLIVDEVGSLPKSDQQQLAQLARVGRSAHLRTLVGNQRCGSDVDPMIRANLTWRLTGKVENARESNLATGISGAGAESLQGRGDMLLVEDGKDIRRFQAARADEVDIAGLLTDAPPEPVEERRAAPATAYEVWEHLKGEAVRAGDGRTVPDYWIIARATEWTLHNGTVPTFAQIAEWSKKRMGKGLSAGRRRDVRTWAETLALQALQGEGGGHFWAS